MKIVNPSVHLIDFQGSDISVVNAARVSFNKESEWVIETIGDEYSWSAIEKLSDKDQKLINYLAKHNHWSPFAHNSLTFRIKAPIFVARQLVKHCVGGVWNEVSRRYVDDEPEFYLPSLWHKAPTNAKQGASEEILNWKAPEFYSYTGSPYGPLEIALEVYNSALKQGMAPEEARMFLPLNTMTEWWWTGSLMFFARVCKQRLDSHAQNATRDIAKMIAEQIPQEFQHSWKALMQ